MRLFLTLLTIVSIPAAFGGDLQSVIATYLCGKVKVGFAVNSKTKELVAYYHNSKFVGVMPTGTLINEKFDLQATTISMNDSVCTYQFKNETMTASNCEASNQTIPNGTCKKL